MDFNLLQEHTIDIYQLKSRDCKVEKVPARSLLKAQRFDLFAKLFYISHIEQDSDTALKIYNEHIKAFNPDGKEPGREDKNGVNDFVTAFDRIIKQFKENEFDASISVIPVAKDGVILDGAHRVAALAYYGKDVTIARFDDVEAKCDFDFNYFKNRGLPWDVADIIAQEMVKWLDQLSVACLWPSTSAKQKQLVMQAIATWHQIAYKKDIRCNLDSLANFVGYIYRGQEWTRNKDYVLDKASRVYGKSTLTLAFFVADASLEDILAEKDTIRQQLGMGKDSLHITDNHAETVDIAAITLDKSRHNQWMASQTVGLLNSITDSLKERWLIFKKVQWIGFKVRVSNRINRIKQAL